MMKHRNDLQHSKERNSYALALRVASLERELLEARAAFGKALRYAIDCNARAQESERLLANLRERVHALQSML